MQIKDAEGCTALHFASYQGNIRAIRLLIANGADPFATSTNGANVLHVAAQGDQPLSIAYFVFRQMMNINSVDNDGENAMHWACLTGSELTTTYLIAWGCNIHARNWLGETPLFSAIKPYENMQKTPRGVKYLLSSGADPNARNNKGQTAHYLLSESSEFTGDPEWEIKRLLDYRWTFLGDFLMIRTVYKKLKRSNQTFFIYLILMGSAFLTFWLTLYYILDEIGAHSLLLQTNYWLFAIAVLMNCVVKSVGPGYLEQKKDFDWVDMLERFEPGSLCAECGILKTPRSRHCPMCNRCVDRQDHHCPWVNNCVGRKNFKYFYIFLVFQVSYLISALIAVLAFLYAKVFYSSQEWSEKTADISFLAIRTWVVYFFTLVAIVFAASVT